MFFDIYLADVLRAFWINGLVSYIILGILVFIGLLNILSLFLSWHLHHAYDITFIIVPQYLNVLFFFFSLSLSLSLSLFFVKFLFYLLSSLGGFYWDTLALSSETLSSAMTSLLVMSWDVFLISVILSFISSFLFFLISEFPSLCLPCLSAIVWHLFYSREHLAY